MGKRLSEGGTQTLAYLYSSISPDFIQDVFLLYLKILQKAQETTSRAKGWQPIP